MDYRKDILNKDFDQLVEDLMKDLEEEVSRLEEKEVFHPDLDREFNEFMDKLDHVENRCEKQQIIQDRFNSKKKKL